MITVFLWIAIGSLLVVIPTAIAARVLHEFSRFELEVYCRRKNRPERFDEVLDEHEKFALGAEAFQWIGTVSFLLASSFYWFATSASTDGSSSILVSAGPGLILWWIGVCFLLVLINSWIPWAVVKLASAPFLFHTWEIWRLTSRLAFPMSIGFTVIQSIAHRIAGRQEDDEEAEEEALEEEIRTIVTAGERDGLLESPAREMIEGVINLDDIDVGDIMTPRSRVNALDINLPPREMIRQVIDFGHTRIPIYENEFEKIIGILFVKDLLPLLLDGGVKSIADIRAILRPPQFVPISIHSDELLQQFRESHSHLSIVVDEYESIMGVVTIEDVLEEIVGEITDETDDEQISDFARIDEHKTEVLANAKIDDLNEHLKIDLPESDEFDTLAGLVMTHFGRIPREGESFVEGNIKIEVQKASRRRIESLVLEVLEESEFEG